MARMDQIHGPDMVPFNEGEEDYSLQPRAVLWGKGCPIRQGLGRAESFTLYLARVF